MPPTAQATITTLAEFPEGYFLENLAVRSDGSVLVTAMSTKELWYVPTPENVPLPIKPILVHTFEKMTLFVVESEPDVFIVGTSDVYESHEAELYRIDLSRWRPGNPIAPELLLRFPEPHVGLNGGCLIASTVLFAAGAANLIWRVDLEADTAVARVWLQHDSMKNRPGEKKPEQPGVNGLRYDRLTNHVYYTSTSQQLMMRVAVDTATLAPAGLPEFIAGGRQWDDFVIDEQAGVAYVTTHRENTIDRVVLQPDGNRAGRVAIAGDPFIETLVGPSSGAWARGTSDSGHVAYFTTDGGTALSPDGTKRPATLVRAVLPGAP
jgi:hypothetical protein